MVRLNRSTWAFILGVLRYLMVFVEPSNFLIEVLHAFRAIVGKHGLKRIGKDLGNDPEEFAGQPINRGSEWPRQRQIGSSDR